jgi:hypothetical protein
MRKMHLKEPKTIWFYSCCHDCVISCKVVAIDDEGIFYDKDDDKIANFSSTFDNERDAREYAENVIYPRMRKPGAKALIASVKEEV